MASLHPDIPYTKVPNAILDHIMAELRGGEVKVLLAICRKTFGFHKELDQIALSQFESLTGMERKTVIDSIRSLVKKNFIIKETQQTPYSYRLNTLRLYPENQADQKRTKKSGSSNIIPLRVQKVNQPGVQKLHLHKERENKHKRNTTRSRSLSEDELEVIKYWNEVFENTFTDSNSSLTTHVQNALSKFTVNELKKAIFNRSHSKYYIEKKPELIDKPTAFFPYLETITNDLNRKPEGIYDYEGMIGKVTSSNLTTDDFNKVKEVTDKTGRPMWKLKDSKSD